MATTGKDIVVTRDWQGISVLSGDPVGTGHTLRFKGEDADRIIFFESATEPTKLSIEGNWVSNEDPQVELAAGSLEFWVRTRQRHCLAHIGGL